MGILSVSRCEYKYLMNQKDAVQLKSVLSEILVLDRGQPYKVRSLYFDSINNIDFHAKMGGENIRKKIRLRIYDADAMTAKLELKAKEGKYQQKKSLLVSKNDAIRLTRGEYSILLDYEEETALELYTELMCGCYRPAVLIEYDREAYIYPEFNTRITFDFHVCSSEVDLNLFSKEIPWNPVIDEQVILEVKFNEILVPVIRSVLSRFPLTNVSVSKYTNGRAILGAII